MKKTGFLILSLIIASVAISCDFLGPKADVYVTSETYDNGQLSTVKFLEPTANAAYSSNQFSSNLGTVEYNGFTWYHFQIPAGSYDVYFEWTGTPYTHNGRAGIAVDPVSVSDQWAAVYTDDGGNSWAETGSGTFAPIMQYYP